MKGKRFTLINLLWSILFMVYMVLSDFVFDFGIILDGIILAIFLIALVVRIVIFVRLRKREYREKND